jgi:hypothetical protein
MTAKNSKTWLLVVFFLGVSELISLPAVGVEKKVTKGLIYGIVTYQDRKPVKGATVYATPLGRPIGAIIPHADSDETGYYAIRIPRSWFGRFPAKKEDEDYPNMSWQFYSDGKFQTVTLSASHPETNVIIRLGPKAGVLLVELESYRQLQQDAAKPFPSRNSRLALPRAEALSSVWIHSLWLISRS